MEKSNVTPLVKKEKETKKESLSKLFISKRNCF